MGHGTARALAAGCPHVACSTRVGVHARPHHTQLPQRLCARLPAPQGTSGECGLRGGYVEMTNIHPGAVEEIYKCCSINLCPNTMGQVRHEQQGGAE